MVGNACFTEFEKDELEQSISQRFEQQAGRYPAHLAVKANKHELTYKALNQAANRVARVIARHAPVEEPIALLLEQGAPVIIAVLGVLKAGGIYVPLDPSYPRARINYLLEDSRAGLIVTNDQNLPLAKDLAGSGRQVINIDAIDSSLPSDNLDLSIAPDTLACIIYTSGSTGQPKGVVENHRNVLHRTMGYTNAIRISADDRLTCLYSCSFAAARGDTFGALLNGATVYPLNIVEEGLDHLADLLIREEISIYNSPPTVFRYLLRTLTGEEEFPKLRLVTLGTEPVSRRDVELYKAYFSQDCIFVNRLGSTETGAFRYYFVDKETEIAGGVVPVGYGAEDTEVLLLDDAGEEVGFNQIGEIAVKSRYLSLGFWRQPGLTREAFAPDPAGGNERIYRTGDLGRLLPDGCLLHLGRKDFQIKIRGNRIEPAEVEMALLDVTGVEEAVCAARENREGEQALVAYLVVDQKFAPPISEFRSRLKARLPEYLVPSAFILLKELPLTPNGKLDRKSLPAPDFSHPELENAYAQPRTPVEEQLVEIWEEVLGLERVGIHDHFFELGGHSLLATRVVSRLREVFGVELPLRSLFEESTVAGLSGRIEAARWVARNLQAPPTTAMGDRQELEL